MRISYAITVADEVVEFTRLIEFLKEHVKSEEDEIVILVDQGKASEAIYKVLNTLTLESGFPINTTIRVEKFGGDFADWKNKLNSICIGDWIFQLDADEVPSEALVDNLHQILETTTAEAIAVPRKNIVEGITTQDIQEWGWVVRPEGINWPDYQWRLYRNDTRIRWVGKVHEVIRGYKVYAYIPSNQIIYQLNHFKNIEKQRTQNRFYKELMHDRF